MDRDLRSEVAAMARSRGMSFSSALAFAGRAWLAECRREAQILSNARRALGSGK